MKKTIKLKESQLVDIVKKVIKEDERPRGGALFSDSVDVQLIDEIISTMTKLHTKGFIKNDQESKEKYLNFKRELKRINREFN